MFPTWRMKLRDARTACQLGRYEEAGVMLADEKLREFLPAKQLAQQVADKMLERAGNRFALGDSTAGWRDLNTADRLGGSGDTVLRLRSNYANQSLAEVRLYLAAIQPAPAVARLEKLRHRGVAGEQVYACQQIAARLQDAEALTARGHFTEANAAISRATAV